MKLGALTPLLAAFWAAATHAGVLADGCWQIGTHSAIEQSSSPQTAAQFKDQGSAKMTPNGVDNAAVRCKISDIEQLITSRGQFDQVTPHSFSATVHASTITTFKGKWISATAPHPPNGVTDLNGKKPVGAQAVAGLDPYRIVAVIDDKQLIADQAWKWVQLVPPGQRNAYHGRLPDLLQQLYIQKAVAAEALRMHLDMVDPWKSRLHKLGHDTAHAIAGVTNYPGDPNIPPQLLAQSSDARNHILWDAYFAQSGSGDVQALQQQLRARYQIRVIDPDFFGDVR